MHGDFHVEGYDIEGLLGAGPAGEVWLAREQSSGLQVALKRVRPRSTEAHDEARRIVSLLDAAGHPHLSRIREMLPDGNELVFVLDYAEGGSLGQLLLARGTLDPGEVVTMATTIAGALAAVHDLGLVHADVTPENVLFSADARLLLADVGFLGLVEGGEAGTLGYTDPDTGPGGEPTRAGDVYGLAAVCYTALTGSPPEPGRGHRPLHQVAPGVPPGLAHAVEAGLQNVPGQRPAAEQFGTQLAAACPAAPVRFPDESPVSGSSFLGGVSAPPDVPPQEQDPFVIGGPGPASDPRFPPQGPQTFPGPPTSADPPQPGPTQPGPTQPGPGPQPGPPPGPPRRAHGPESGRPAFPDRLVDDQSDDDEEPRRRFPVVAVVVGVVIAVAVGTLGVFGWQTVAGGPPPDDPTAAPRPTSSRSAKPSTPPRSPAEARWTDVLTTLDRRRAEAWRQMDADLLGKVYASGSKPLQEELALMSDYESKDVTSVIDLNTPIKSLEVVSEGSDRVVVDAVSELQPYSIVAGGETLPRAGGEPRRFRVTLEPDGSGGWLIAESNENGSAGGPR